MILNLISLFVQKQITTKMVFLIVDYLDQENPSPKTSSRLIYYYFKYVTSQVKFQEDNNPQIQKEIRIESITIT